MKRILTKQSRVLYCYVNGNIVYGKNPNMRGDCSGLRGNCTELSGNCSGLRGNCTGLRGDIDNAGLTDEDRQRGVDIEKLVV